MRSCSSRGGAPGGGRGGMKHNNVIPNNHFRKHWHDCAAHKGRIRTWFNQPGRKVSRRNARAAKAKAVFPRPLGKLRPLVHGQTKRYNMKVKLGKGFSLDELKEAGIPAKLAPTIGIAVDNRRRNISPEELQTATQLGGTTVMPPKKKAPTLKMVALDSEQKNNKAFAKLRVERMNQRMVGIRHKRALAEEAAAKEAAKLK